MALTYNDVRFEMFLERETMAAIRTGKVSWYDREDVEGYRCDGLDPGMFPSRVKSKPEVPMKTWSADHRIALKWFARTKRAGRISLPPTHLLTASLPAQNFLNHCLCGDIVIHHETDTYGFRKSVDQINYPGLVVELIEFPNDDAQRMLDTATEHLM